MTPAQRVHAPSKYRAEIDGLRAIAILPVIFFHAGFTEFRGGYVGVDVFFVISGYLIAALVYEEIRGGTFSIAHFYDHIFYASRRQTSPAFRLVVEALRYRG